MWPESLCQRQNTIHQHCSCSAARRNLQNNCIVSCLLCVFATWAFSVFLPLLVNAYISMTLEVPDVKRRKGCWESKHACMWATPPTESQERPRRSERHDVRGVCNARAVDVIDWAHAHTGRSDLVIDVTQSLQRKHTSRTVRSMVAVSVFYTMTRDRGGRSVSFSGAQPCR